MTQQEAAVGLAGRPPLLVKGTTRVYRMFPPTSFPSAVYLKFIGDHDLFLFPRLEVDTEDDCHHSWQRVGEEAEEETKCSPTSSHADSESERGTHTPAEHQPEEEHAEQQAPEVDASAYVNLLITSLNEQATAWVSDQFQYAALRSLVKKNPAVVPFDASGVNALLQQTSERYYYVEFPDANVKFPDNIDPKPEPQAPEAYEEPEPDHTATTVDKPDGREPHDKMTLPSLPNAAADWTGDDGSDFKAIGRLAASTLRSIEPVGPHFLAHARRARHKRTFSEDDRIQAQEGAKKIEENDDSDISEPETADLLMRDAKDWKVSSCISAFPRAKRGPGVWGQRPQEI